MPDAFRKSLHKLREAGISTPELDGEVLLAFSLGISRNDLLLHIAPEIPASFHKLIDRRCKHEPIAYIVGKKEFWDLEFIVDNNVLIPRPETETIIEQVLLKYPNTTTKLRFLDMGTGSGCIILTLLNIYKNSSGIGSDISEAALKVAQSNAAHLGIDRIKLLKSDWFTQIEPQTFDIIIANPPYIGSSEKIAVEVKEYEPHLALFGGEDGLQSYSTIARHAAKYLAKNGTVLVEIGYAQGLSVQNIFTQHKFTATIHKDLEGKDRVVSACFFAN